MLGNPSKRTLRTWLIMVGAFVGAGIALSISVTFSWNNGAEGGAGGGKPEMSPVQRAALHSAPGACLNWQQPGATDIHTVPCGAPHLYEVTSVENVANQFPPGVPAPAPAAWQDIASARCPAGAEAYLGKQLDPHGKFGVSAMRPGAQEWKDGNRELRCVLQWAGPGGGLQPSSTPAAEGQQAAVWEPGTCLGLRGKSVGDPVDCAQPHSYEIIATRDLAEEFDDDYPSQDDQKGWLDTECTKAADEYSDGANLDKKGLIVSWDLRERESWDAGSTMANCKIAATLPDKSGLAPVTGSIRKPSQEPAAPPPRR